MIGKQPLILGISCVAIIPLFFASMAVATSISPHVAIPTFGQNETSTTVVIHRMKFNISHYQKILKGENQTLGMLAISKIFIELIPTCTVHFHGAFRDDDEIVRDINWMFISFFNICATFPSAYCVQISTNNVSMFHRHPNSGNQFTDDMRPPSGSIPSERWMSQRMNQGAASLNLINHRFFALPAKYGERCLVLVDTSVDPYCTAHLYGMPFSGRFSPNFIFLYRRYYAGVCGVQDWLIHNGSPPYKFCGMYEGHSQSFSEDEGTSIVLTITKYPDAFLMECFDRLVIDDLLLRKNLTVSDLISIWENYRSDIQIEHFCHAQPPPWDMPRQLQAHVDNVTHISSKICGDTPLVRIYKESTRRDPTSIFMRIWDAQEQCVYETILNKYFKSNNSFLKSYTKIIWPVALEFGEAWTDNRQGIDGWGKTGKFYTPFGARMQGYQYAIFIDRDSLKSEFDMQALLQPFDYLTWVHLVGTMAAMTLTFRLLSKSFNATWLFSALMEQAGLVRKFPRSYAITILALVWVYASILLRFSYTTKMYSAITADKDVVTPKNFSELVKHPFKDIFNMFVPHEESKRLLQWKGKDLFNISEQVLWDSVTPLMHEDLLQLIKKREPNRLTALFENSQGEIKMSRPHPRIALLSYSHPNKLIYDEKWEEHDRRNVNPKLWEKPFPYSTLLSKVGGRVIIPGENSQIRNRLWLYHGKRNYFTDRFVRDLGGLVESGIFGRWEYLAGKYSEAMYLESLEIDKGKYRNNLTGNFITAACTLFSDTMGKSYQPATNYTILVIWVVYWTCLVICIFSYLKEIVRFDLPGRSLYCSACHVEKYKQE